MWKVVLEVARGYLPWIERGLPSAALLVGLVALTVGVCARSSVGGAEDSVSGLSVVIDAARSDVAGVSAEMETTRGFLTGVSQRADAADGEIRTVAASLATTGGELEAARTDLQASIDGLVARQAALDATLTSTGAKVTANREAWDALGTGQTALQKSLDDLTDGLAAAVADLEADALRLGDLKDSFGLTRDDVKANTDATGVNAGAITALAAEQAASDAALASLQRDVAILITKINTATLYAAVVDAYSGWKAASALAQVQPGASDEIGATQAAMANAVELTEDTDLRDAYINWVDAPGIDFIITRNEAQFLGLLGDRLTAALAPG